MFQPRKPHYSSWHSGAGLPGSGGRNSKADDFATKLWRRSSRNAAGRNFRALLARNCSPATQALQRSWDEAFRGTFHMFAWFQRLLPRRGDFFGMFEAHAATLVGGAEALQRLASDRGSTREVLKIIRD